MNVGIWNEAMLFHFWVYINLIFGTVCTHLVQDRESYTKAGRKEMVTA